MTSSATVAGSCHVHSLSPLAISNQVQGAGYSESEVETDVIDLKLETDVAALKLETNAAALELETNATVLDWET
jgi:citrate lyase synthetase